MKQCIICRELRDDFTDEHVIPDSINGYYHIYSLCSRCNNKMGSEVDNKLTNHKFIEFQRQVLGIRGKRGTVPDPLKGTYSLKENPSQKIVLKLDSNGYPPDMELKATETVIEQAKLLAERLN